MDDLIIKLPFQFFKPLLNKLQVILLQADANNFLKTNMESLQSDSRFHSTFGISSTKAKLLSILFTTVYPAPRTMLSIFNELNRLLSIYWMPGIMLISKVNRQSLSLRTLPIRDSKSLDLHFYQSIQLRSKVVNLKIVYVLNKRYFRLHVHLNLKNKLSFYLGILVFVIIRY